MCGSKQEGFEGRVVRGRVREFVNISFATRNLGVKYRDSGRVCFQAQGAQLEGKAEAEVL